jgi:glycosyltransferase involved in cell wall biosynthesis
MIETMATGTPVIAFNRGSVPEIIEQGRTGFIVNSIEEAVKAVEKLPAFDRTACRQAFDNRFTAKIMAEKYVRV